MMCPSRLALLITMALGINAVTLQDLMSALHTFEKVWVRYRSYERSTLGHKHTCLYNEVRSHRQTSYLFTQHYEVDLKWRSQQVYASVFQGKRGETVMRLSQRPGTYGVDHTLVFWHPVEHCFVFTRIFEGKRHCEMWVWGDHVRKHVPQCQLAYKRHCSPQYPVYTHACGPP
ncbi:uncharacterized protein LOC119458392 [Dermacentor silvarum]|uniref:uncharacterized protein LOC119458392 n=1 Tax=Dermacentor silvarum TaxID=543639 RepID=UPI001899E3A2|nr:uncharacterized protein LOC119458392 [Dermacentor silvarum]